MDTEEKLRAAWVEIDTKVAIKNFENIKKRARETDSNRKICAVVKANSYGMGSVEMSRLYVKSGVDMLAVAVITEALEIRSKISDISILVLGYTPEAYYIDAIDNDITLTIYNKEQAIALNDIASKIDKIAKVHIKVETGMNRLGILALEKNVSVVREIVELSNVYVEGIFTHFARADEKDKTSAHMQGILFRDFIYNIEEAGIKIPIVHAANSAAIIDLPEYHYDMVRPGIILLGFYPSDEVDKKKLKLQPCISLKAKLANVKTIQNGEGVSYGHTFRADREMVVGTVPLGYADGLSRSLSNRFYVMVKGVKCQQIGKICMDQFMIDLTGVNNPQIGDEVIIYGNGKGGALTMDDIAKLRDTISYEVGTNLSNRLPRKYI